MDMLTIETHTEIRLYQESDFSMLNEWWQRSDEPGPLPSMIPDSSTWVLELNGQPALSVSLIYTNITEYCYVENFVGNPDLKGPGRAKATKYLLKYIEERASALGYKRLLCLGYRPKIMNLYKELGFTPTLNGLTSFVKPLDSE